MEKIKVEKLSKQELQKMKVFSWPIWEKDVSKFNWSYDTQERCYILEGIAKVEPYKGDSVEFGTGDFITFPKGLKCVWNIKKKIRKHYNLK